MLVEEAIQYILLLVSDIANHVIRGNPVKPYLPLPISHPRFSSSYAPRPSLVLVSAFSSFLFRSELDEMRQMRMFYRMRKIVRAQCYSRVAGPYA